MGAKDSKPSFITYEDAVKRVSDSELRRIREAFKRCAGANGTALSLEAFVHEVLCDGVPYDVAEWLYQACGGTKRGIAFKELLCGIVVLTKGNLEEKIKFLWTLYVNNQGDNGSYIYKKDFARALHLENTSLPATAAQRSAEILLGLFGAGDKVTFDQFRSWLLIHKYATVLSKWLLSEVNDVYDLETPTFYQTLAGVTHLEERDIIELEKCFWSLRNGAPTGQLDAESLGPLLSPPLPAAAVAGTFLAFDENRDGHVDFKELCCGLSAACRGPTTERLKFCFKIFDLDSDGLLNKKELIDMVSVLCEVANENLKNQGSRSSTPDGSEVGIQNFDPDVILANLRDKLVVAPKNGRKPNFHLGPSGDTEDIINVPQSKADGDVLLPETVLTLEDFLIWSVESAHGVVTPFLDLVYQVCHIVLGLRPHCRHSERDIVLGWLRRSVARGYSVGQFWYLVAAEWWGAWLAYTGDAADACCRPATLADDSFMTNSTESMGSLLWRCETASVDSAGSSSGVSSAASPRRHPGSVRNKRLLADNTLKVRTLTGEGGHLRRDVTLAQHRDFELVPDALWRALALWYGGPDPLPRQVIRPPNSDVELELYPLQLKIMRHVPAALGTHGSAGCVPDRQLAYTAAFSRLATIRQVGAHHACFCFVCCMHSCVESDVTSSTCVPVCVGLRVYMWRLGSGTRRHAPVAAGGARGGRCRRAGGGPRGGRAAGRRAAHAARAAPRRALPAAARAPEQGPHVAGGDRSHQLQPRDGETRDPHRPQPAGSHRPAQPGEHLLHERGAAVGVEHGPADALLQLRHAPVRGEPRQPAGHRRRAGRALRGAVQGGTGC